MAQVKALNPLKKGSPTSREIYRFLGRGPWTQAHGRGEGQRAGNRTNLSVLPPWESVFRKGV